MGSAGTDGSNSQGDGPQVGRYRRIVPVCQDTIGTTWLAVVTQGEDAGRQVLLTVVPQSPDSLAAQPLLAAARREIKVRHSAVLAFLDVELEPERIFFVTEAMEGEPLCTFMASAAQHREPISASIALRIVKEAIDALRALRRSGGSTAHGLLNPETLFVASCGEVLLRQPGLKAAALTIAGFRRHASILPYQAPEVLCDEREDEDCADVFSAGVLLWEMIAGRGLFGPLEQFRLGRTTELSASAAESLRARVLSEKIPSLSSVVRIGGAVSPDVARLVDWMLARDPAERPQSLDDLSRVLENLPASAIATGAQVGQFVRRIQSGTFHQREQLVARVLLPSQPPSVRSMFPEPSTTPRSLALSARLLREVPQLEDDGPPAAIVPIFPSAPQRGRREGIWATAAGVLLAVSLGGYFVASRTSARSSAVLSTSDSETKDSSVPSENTGVEGKESALRDDASSGQRPAPEGSSEQPHKSPLKDAESATPSASRPTLKAAPVVPPSRSSAAKPPTKPVEVESSRSGFRPSGI